MTIKKETFFEDRKQCWNFTTIYGGLETSRNSVVVPAFQSPNVQTFKEPKNRSQGINFVSLCSLVGQYDNPIPTRFIAPIDCLKIPAQAT